MEDPLFITEEDSSNTAPSKSAILSDESPKATDESSPEFQITVSVRSQTESTPSQEAAPVVKSTLQTMLTKPKSAPRFIELPKSITTDSKSTATFLCIVQGDPKPSVSWKKDGQTLSMDHRYELSEGNGEISLKIRDVTVADQGLYTCTLTNSEGESSASADLFVEGT